MSKTIKISIGIVIVFILVVLAFFLFKDEDKSEKIDEEYDIYSYKMAINNGNSMSPTLNDNDSVRVKVKEYLPIERNDIILFENDGNKLIKRVIGLPYETIEMRNNLLYINGEEITEDYLADNVITNDFTFNNDNCYFVLGDNREISLDSRMFGCIEESDIIGKIELEN